MEAELFREINGRFLLNELGDPTFLFHLFKENTTLHDISKLEEFFIIQFSNIPINSLLQFYRLKYRRSLEGPPNARDAIKALNALRIREMRL